MIVVGGGVCVSGAVLVGGGGDGRISRRFNFCLRRRRSLLICLSRRVRGEVSRGGEAGVGSRGGNGGLVVEGVVTGVVVAWGVSVGLGVVGLSCFGVVGETVVGAWGNWDSS